MAAACFLAGLLTGLQAWYVFSLDVTPLELPPLYVNVLQRLLSCGAVFAGVVLSAGRNPLLRSVPLRALILASVCAFAFFEILYLFSRLPAISPVSFPVILRPARRMLPGMAIVFLWAYVSFATRLTEEERSSRTPRAP